MGPDVATQRLVGVIGGLQIGPVQRQKYLGSRSDHLGDEVAAGDLQIDPAIAQKPIDALYGVFDRGRLRPREGAADDRDAQQRLRQQGPHQGGEGFTLGLAELSVRGEPLRDRLQWDHQGALPIAVSYAIYFDSGGLFSFAYNTLSIPSLKLGMSQPPSTDGPKICSPVRRAFPPGWIKPTRSG